MSLDGLSDILIFFPRDGEDWLVMVLGANFDESIRNKEGTEPISVAGYVFKPAGYKHFSRAWSRMLVSGPTPTTHFHMTHLYARSYEYDCWSVDDRADMLRQAVTAVQKYSFCGISVMFSQSEFERLAPNSWKDDFGSMYSVACQMALRTTAYWMDQHKCDLPIAYFFESGHKFWDQANALLTGTGRHPELKLLYRYHSHTAIDKLKSHGLQSADMLAWIMTRLNVGVPDNHTMNAFAPIIMDMVTGRSDRYQLFHPNTDGLKRFFDENLSNANRVTVGYNMKQKLALR